jgi:hypothetical protein
MLKATLIVLACFILFIFFHFIIFHNLKVRRRFRSLFIIWLSLLAIYALLFFLIPEDKLLYFINPFISLKIVDFLNGIFFFLLISFFYLHLIEFVDRSITTRIMVEIENSPTKTLTLKEIKKRYSLKEKLSYELEDMLYLKVISKDSGYFKNTPKGSYYARFIKFLRDFLRLC